MSTLNVEAEFKSVVQHFIAENAAFDRQLSGNAALYELCDRLGVKLDADDIARRTKAYSKALKG